MAKAQQLSVVMNRIDPLIEDRVSSLLQDEHGVHGVKILGYETLRTEMEVQPVLELSSMDDEAIKLQYTDEAGEKVMEIISSEEVIPRVISAFAVKNLFILTENQTSRSDFSELEMHRGERPNLESDPSLWIVNNPFIADLCRRFPQYGNLVRYLCNERGLFLKVGNYPKQRAYWNSSTNGGLPVYKKADPIHEGTFMLHDMFHFVPKDPVIGAQKLEKSHKAAYIAHRLLSEASTLVLADMVAVADADLGKAGYDTSKRRIFPIYESIVTSKGSVPDVDKLLAANAFFCFTGNPEGFKLLGASQEAVSNYKSKYESIFRDDFAWNIHNWEAMVSERASNPRISEYYNWLDSHTDLPSMASYSSASEASDAGTDIPKMLSLFRADYKNALGYHQPIDNIKRCKLASEKYFAGQRIVFARFGEYLDPTSFMHTFDQHYDKLAQADDVSSINELTQKINHSVDAYLQILYDSGQLLPHELAIYRFSAPLYPVKFINYEKKGTVYSELAQEMEEFMHLNRKQLGRLLETAAA